MVPLTWSFCPRRAATLSPRNDRARYICDAGVVALADQGALFREAKDTLERVVLKMHWIRTIESFYLGWAKKRSNESAQRNGWASHSRGTIGRRERIIISPSVRCANKLKTVTHGLTRGHKVRATHNALPYAAYRIARCDSPLNTNLRPLMSHRDDRAIAVSPKL